MGFLCAQLTDAQRKKTELVLNDGTILKGLGKLMESTVKYRPERKSKPKHYPFEMIAEATFFEKWGPVTYHYVAIKDKKRPLMLRLVNQGKVTLYEATAVGYAPNASGGMGSPGGAAFGGGYFYSIDHFYLKRKNEDKAVHIGSNQLFSKNFKKTASGYFSDCPALVEKIQNREFKKKHLKEIVTYYNTQCE